DLLRCEVSGMPDGWGSMVSVGRLAAGVLAITILCGAAREGAADTLEGALLLAYQNNPQLNSQRAILRQTDEGVPQALAGYRPRISATASVGTQNLETLTRANPGSTPAIYGNLAGNNVPH